MPWHPHCPALRHYRGDEPADDPAQQMDSANQWPLESGRLFWCGPIVHHFGHQLGEFGGRILLDIQQVIPLPEAAQYQVAIREKEAQQAVVRTSERNLTKYQLTIGDRVYSNLAGRRVIYELIAEAISQGVTIATITEALAGKGGAVFLSAEGRLSEEELRARTGNTGSGFFCQDGLLLHAEGRTLAVSKRWGDQLMDSISSVSDLISFPAITIEVSTPTMEPDIVRYGGYEC